MITVTQAGSLFFHQTGFWTAPRRPQAHFLRRVLNTTTLLFCLQTLQSVKEKCLTGAISHQPGPTPDRDESLRFQVQTSETGPRLGGREPSFKKHAGAKRFICNGKAIKRAPKKSICDDNNHLKGHRNIYSFHKLINKLLSEEYKVPRTLFEAGKVAGSATYKQNKTVFNCAIIWGPLLCHESH